MITAIHSITIAVRNLTSSVAAFDRLLGRAPESLDGRASFQLGNMALRLVDSDSYEGLESIAFSTSELSKARHVLQRRGLSVTDGDLGSIALSNDSTHGVAISAVQSESVAAVGAPGAATVTGLDHVVITTSHPERAAALYGARLGLEMKLDRTNADWGSRLMFFRCGDLIVEIAHSLKNADPDAPDKLWGLSWRVASIVAAHARIGQAGFDVSEIRTGRKPGTRVFTIRDAPCGVPTMILGRDL